MADDRPRRSRADLADALGHVEYELQMCAAAAIRVATGAAGDSIEFNAYLESTLLHARNLYEFLVATPRQDDMGRIDFATENWDARECAPETVRQLEVAVRLLHKHLAHLTWARVDAPSKPRWETLAIADGVARLVQAWAEAVQRDDPSEAGRAAKALVAVAESAKRVIAQARAQHVAAAR
jgi:hypothetical protein